MLGHTQLTTHTTHLVLEEPFQRLTQLQVHLFGQATHIVMALDDLAGDIQTLDAVGINRTLGQPFGIRYLVGLGIKDINETLADYLALTLGFCYAGQLAEEFLAGIDAYHIEPQTLVVVEHIAELVLAQHTVVHENTGEVAADGLVEQNGGYRAVHTTTQAENDAVIAQLGFQLGHSGIYKRGGTPILPAAANVDDEILQQLLSLQGMEHFGMKLHAPKRLIVCLIGGILHLVGGSNDAEACRNFRNRVAMAHPYLRLVHKILEKRVLLLKTLQMGTTILATAGRFYLAAVNIGHVLRSVANAQNGQTATDPT